MTVTAVLPAVSVSVRVASDKYPAPDRANLKVIDSGTRTRSELPVGPFANFQVPFFVLSVTETEPATGFKLIVTEAAIKRCWKVIRAHGSILHYWRHSSTAGDAKLCTAAGTRSKSSCWYKSTKISLLSRPRDCN